MYTSAYLPDKGKPIEDFFVYRFIQKFILRWRGPETVGEGTRLSSAPPRRAVVLVCLGILLLAASVMLLQRLDKRWMTTMFRIA